MSGIDLRKAAIDGDADSLKDNIIKRCNPCSVDEYGLSPLHYAVWNGHIECVKLLACNTLGVDVNGLRAKSMELKSCMGYTGTGNTMNIRPSSTIAFLISIIFSFSFTSGSIRLSQTFCYHDNNDIAHCWC